MSESPTPAAPNPPGSPGSHGRGPEPSAKTPPFTLKATGDAAKNFDFLAGRPPGKRTTVIESVGHLVKSALGGGVVSIHASYKLCGLWTAVVLNVFLGLLVGYLMYVLAKSAQKAYGRTQTTQMSYPDLAQCSMQISRFEWLKKYAYTFRHAVDATIMIDLFGSCCCYMVIIAKTINQLLMHYTGQEQPLRLVVASLLIPCILICMILSLKYLAPVSIVADVIIITVAICTIIYGSQAAGEANRKPSDMPVFGTFTGLLNFLGVCVFSMEGVGATLPIENSMQNPQRVGEVVTYGMAIIIIIVMTVGFFGYWGFGDAANSPVTLNFPLTGFALLLKFSMGLMVYATFALNFWVPFDLAWVYLKRRHANSANINTIQRIYRTVFICGITGIAIAFPSVNHLIGVIGVFCLTNMGFIYPAFIQLLLEWDDPGLGVMKWRLWRFIIIFVFAMLLMIVGTAFNFIEMIEQVYGKKKTSDFDFE